MLSITRADLRPCTRGLSRLGALPVRAGARGGWAPMLYSTRVQQRARITADHGGPLGPAERSLTLAYAAVHGQVPVSGGQGVAGSNPAVPTGQRGFVPLFLILGSQLGSQWLSRSRAASSVAFAFRDAVHNGGAIGEGRRDLVTGNRLGDRRAAVPRLVDDVLRADIVHTRHRPPPRPSHAPSDHPARLRGAAPG